MADKFTNEYLRAIKGTAGTSTAPAATSADDFTNKYLAEMGATNKTAQVQSPATPYKLRTVLDNTVKPVSVTTTKAATPKTDASKTETAKQTTVAPKNATFWEKLGLYLSGSTDTTLPNVQANDSSELIAENALSGAVDSAKGAVNLVNYYGQGAMRGKLASAEAQQKADAAITGSKGSAALADNFKQTREAQEAKGLTAAVDWGKGLKQDIADRSQTADKATLKIGEVANTVGGIVPSMVSNAVAPGSGLLVMGAGAAGNAIEQAKAEGASDAGALTYGTAVGAIEAATEKMFDGVFGVFGKGVADDAVEKLVTKYVKSGTAQNAILTLTSMLGEGAEEFVAEVTENWMNRLTAKTDDRRGLDLLSDAGKSAAMGALVSALFQGAQVMQRGDKITAAQVADNAVAAIDGGGAAQNTQNAVQAPVIAQDATQAKPVTYTANAPEANTAQQGTEQEKTEREQMKAEIKTSEPITQKQVTIRGQVPSNELSTRELVQRIKAMGRERSASYGLFAAERDLKPEIDAKEFNEIWDSVSANAHNTVESVGFTPTHTDTLTGRQVQIVDKGNLYEQIWDTGMTGTTPKQLLDTKRFKPIETSSVNPTDSTGAAPQSNGIFPQGSLGAKITGELPSGVGAMSNPFAPKQEVSKVFTNTYQKTDSITDAERAQMKPEDYTYDVIGHAQNESTSQQRVDVDYEGEVADLYAKQDWTGEDVFTAKKILDKVAEKARETGDYSEFNKWTKAIQQRGTSGGQTIEAFKAFQKTPEGAVIKAQQVVDAAGQKLTTKKENGKTVKTSLGRKIASDVENVTKIVNALVNGESTTGMAKTLHNVTLKSVKELVASGKYDADAINDLVRAKYGIPTLTAADVQKIYELNNLAQEATNDYQKRVFLNRAAMVIADKMPVTKKNKVLAVRRIAMLLNPKTLISRNAGGNVIFGLLEDIKDAPGTLIDLGVSKLTGQRTTSYNPFATSKAEFLGAKKGLVEWGKDIKNGVDTSPTEHEMPRSSALKSKIGSATEEALNKLLQLGDRPFFEAAKAKRLDEMKRLGLDYTSEDATADATAYALERVFQNNSALAKSAMKLRESLGVLGDIAIPFAQTPSNILDKLIDYSPYGYVRAIKKAGTVGDSAWSQKQFVDTLARSMTGTGLIAFGFAAAMNGLLTGGGDDGEDEGETYQNKVSGWQPYSVFVDGKSYTYDWATVGGVLLGFGADMANMADGKADVLSILMNGTTMGINTLFNQSYLTGVSDLFGGDDIGKGIEDMLIGLPSSFTPTALQQIARIVDPIARDTYDTDPFKRAWNKVKAKLPGLSMTLPAKIGADGKEMKNFQGGVLSNIFESVLSPGYINKQRSTAIDTEVQRLYTNTKLTAALPNWSEYTSKSDLTFTTNKVEYEMSSAEWETYQKTRGKYTYKALDTLFKSAAYKAMSDEEKVKAVSGIYDDATAEAKRKIIEGRGEMYLPDSTAVKLVDSFAGAGLSKDKAYSLYKTLDALTPEQGKSSVSNQQKAKTVVQQGYSKTQTVALVGTLWDKTGADECKTLLPSLNVAQRLVTMYVDSGNSDLVNMTTPRTFSENSVTYELTDAEMTQFAKVYADYFNQRATNLMSEDTLVRIKKEAYNRAKYSVINGRK